MDRKIRFRNTPIFDIIMKILSHYQCPYDCQSFCCKVQNIDVDSKDLKILRKASKTKVENVKLIRSNGSLYHSIQPQPLFIRCKQMQRL